MAASGSRWRWGLWSLIAILTVGAVALAAPALVAGQWPWSKSSQPGMLFSPPITGRETGTDRLIAALQQRVRDDGKDSGSMIGLSNLYLQKSRETGDPTLYTKADDLLDRAGQIDPLQAELFAARATLALARHDFAGALQLGQKALVLDTANARYYGIVGDAQIELGLYREAIKSYQDMVDRRPDFNSYSRIAYARELFGDPEGAIQAMQLAVNAGSSFPENVAWANVQLGNLWINFAHPENAAASYEQALRAMPDYAPALAGQARVAAGSGDLDRAASLFRRAFELMPLSEYAIALGDVYALQGQPGEAAAQYDLVLAIDRLLQANGVNTDMETALFYADHDRDLPASLAKARAAYQERPSVHAADVLAWTLYKSGQYQEAQVYADETLKLGTQDPLKLFHAGMIAKALGQNDKARDALSQAMALNPHFSLLYHDLAVAALAQLGGSTAQNGQSN